MPRTHTRGDSALTLMMISGPREIASHTGRERDAISE